MNKLIESEGRKLIDFLISLKKEKWYIDLRDLHIIGEILKWFEKVYGMIDIYDKYEFSTQLSYMTRDLCKYAKTIVNYSNSKKCGRCKKVKILEDFFGRDLCKMCFKKSPKNSD